VGAEFVVTDESGREVARVRTGVDGSFAISLPPGTYMLTPQPVEGIMRTAGPETATVVVGATVTVDFAFDSGIR
jgi:hypothetical protein